MNPLICAFPNKLNYENRLINGKIEYFKEVDLNIESMSYERTLNGDDDLYYRGLPRTHLF